jgi:predicted RNA binding protein YcfA (HicA-like mRNA interferase family)
VILEGFGFIVISVRGSHAKLRRTAPGSVQQTLLVPLHRQPDTGTCRAILRQASSFIDPAELNPLFYAS